jgi:hypothetical protein
VGIEAHRLAGRGHFEVTLGQEFIERIRVPLVSDHVGVVDHYFSELVGVYRIERVVHAQPEAQQLNEIIEGRGFSARHEKATVAPELDGKPTRSLRVGQATLGRCPSS